jgi:mono/diheme cytochrome c family protein
MVRYWLLLAGLVGVLASPVHAQVDFKQDVEPIFHQNCYACHGPSVQMNGLRLDRREATLTGGHSGKAILASDSEASLLIQRVSTADTKLKMPPGDARLSSQDIDTLRAWIDQGAEWPESAEPVETKVSDTTKHWSFQPIVRPEPPAVSARTWVRNPIDQFVLAKLEAEGIEPSPEADKTTLVRRVSLDLTGLPPEPADVDAFRLDNAPGAYERVVDRLLDSPHYGEKWARHWLDLARYADSDGFEKDLDRPHSWRWRHWVIEALNRDMPFDEFTVEQIAGDLLPNATVSQQVATGFHRNTLKNREAGVKRGEARFEELLDRASTVGTVWLGLTVGCAQCHDHKFDPISQREFYQLYSFFDRAREAEILAPLPGEIGPYLQALDKYENKRATLLEEFEIPRLQADWEAKIVRAMDYPAESTEWDFQITSMRAMLDHADQRLHTPPDERTPRVRQWVTDYFIRRFGPELAKDDCAIEAFKELRGKLGELEKALPRPSEAYALEAMTYPVTTHIAVRGDWRRPGVDVVPGVPSVLPPLPEGRAAARLRLARWLVDERNPLTPRVTVNRMWQAFFGTGFVTTPGDFGTQGDAPSHPELLDWLADEFRRVGWSMKQMHKRIVMSATYRQASRTRKELLTRDPGNRLLARQARLRLTAEQIRDAALTASGLLYPRVGGRSIRPVQPEGIAEVTYGSSRWNPSNGKERYRRGLYIQYKRTAPYPMLANFDAPNTSVTAPRRRRSNTPLQALNLLNDPVFFEAAQALAVRVVQAGGDDRFADAFRLCLAREPDSQEKDMLASFWQRQKELFQREPEAVESVIPYEMAGVEPAELAAWVTVARGLMNLDEFITRE